jgi:hypothetical protein
LPGEWEHPKPFTEGNIKTQKKSDRQYLPEKYRYLLQKKKKILSELSYSSCHVVMELLKKILVPIHVKMKHDGDLLVTINVMETRF